MELERLSLEDKFNLGKEQSLLSGTQALIRLMLAQKERDRCRGWNTAGLVTGYRGSPLGSVDIQMKKAERVLSSADIQFMEGLNEDLAATAIWGAQQAELRGEGIFDGVFGLWYGKGPGVDRSGDALKHANLAGTSPKGGVLMALGDDHTGESSTTLHQSDWAMIDAGIPIISPAGVQEILDLGHYGYELSRFSGLWVGLKAMKDTIEATSVVNSNPNLVHYLVPEFDKPSGGLNITLDDNPAQQEARLLEYKIPAAEEFARVNRIDRRMIGRPEAKIGIVSVGKSWLDLAHALSLLNIDNNLATNLSITAYKIAQAWPLDKKSFLEWAKGLDLIVVVEEKRKILEGQIKESLFDKAMAPRVFGERKNPDGPILFSNKGALDPTLIAIEIGKILLDEGVETEELQNRLQRLQDESIEKNTPDLATRTPYFCAGCPHNSSTKTPKGSRAYAGIGCHFMVQWMDRETHGYTHMGGEGANWIGEARFSSRSHVFQNLGDGTYNHSGVQAIRAALAAGTNITYKILFNDAVAMTGGQRNDGTLSAQRIAREILAMGIKDVAVVYDEKEPLNLMSFPKKVNLYERVALMEVQKRFAEIKGVSVIIYVQTCAAEKRRRRRKSKFPNPDKRIFINPEICEGCGDCGVQSNCVALTPENTEFGTKRSIDQSNCNKDFSCISGLCPSFVTLHGANIRKIKTKEFSIPKLPLPEIRSIRGTHNIVITGVGGAGVVTIGAILAQAAQIEGKGAGMVEMAGLSQKGGAVHVHCRLSENPKDINAIRISNGECDALIGGDLVVSAGQKSISLLNRKRTWAVINSHEIITGEFTRDVGFRIPKDQLILALEAKLKGQVSFLDSTKLSKNLLGDTIFSNMIILGAAWQKGLVPLKYSSIFAALELNKVSVENNKFAFEIGRWASIYPNQAAKMLERKSVKISQTLDQQISRRAHHLEEYQNWRLAAKYLKMLDSIDDLKVKEAVAKGYHKLLAYKDEYEVARLHLKTRKLANEQFSGVKGITFHLSPPLISRKDQTGRFKKLKFGSYMEGIFKILSYLRLLRGTPLDIFGYTQERKMERYLICQYEKDISFALTRLNKQTAGIIVSLALLPLDIRGFGLVKSNNLEKAAERRTELLNLLEIDRELTPEAAE